MGEQFFEDDKRKNDNFEVARRICKYFDHLFGDKDTVCLVADTDAKVKYCICAQESYQRAKKLGRRGKFILIYRAEPHVETKNVVKKNEFRKIVNKIAMKSSDTER